MSTTTASTLARESAPPTLTASRRKKQRPMALLFAVPAMALYTVFTIGPLVAVFVVSTRSWTSIIAPSSFAGLDNFQKIFTDDVFWQACFNTLVQLVVVIPILLPVSFMLGFYLAKKPRGHQILRVVLFTPALISLAAKSMIFLSIFSPNGLLNASLNAVGLGKLATPWLADPHTALATVMAVDLWGGIGFLSILFAARLGSIDSAVLEAAQLDGAGNLRQTWQIAYPIARDYFGVLTMLQFIWVLFSSAGSILLLTKGGPGFASTTLSYLLYQKAFLTFQIGYSQAVGVILFVVGVAGILVIRRAFRTEQ